MTLPLLGREEILILPSIYSWPRQHDQPPLWAFYGISFRTAKHLKPRQCHYVIEVPKKWFLHFYVVGIVSSPVVVVLKKTRLDVAMSLLLKFSRSCYQWLYVHVWRADSKMHVPAYAVGLLHYTLLPWNVVIDAPITQQSHDVILRITGI